MLFKFFKEFGKQDGISNSNFSLYEENEICIYTTKNISRWSYNFNIENQNRLTRGSFKHINTISFEYYTNIKDISVKRKKNLFKDINNFRFYSVNRKLNLKIKNKGEENVYEKSFYIMMKKKKNWLWKTWNLENYTDNNIYHIQFTTYLYHFWYVKIFSIRHITFALRLF